MHAQMCVKASQCAPAGNVAPRVGASLSRLWSLMTLHQAPRRRIRL
jgi:hypothetical protein